MLDVVRVAHVKRRDREEDGGGSGGATAADPPPEPVDEPHRRGPGGDAERPAGGVDPGGVRVVQPLQCRQRRHPPGRPDEREVDADPREQDVEVERRVEEVVRVQRALREAERARHDGHFVRVVDRGEPELQPDQAKCRRHHQDCRQHEVPAGHRFQDVHGFPRVGSSGMSVVTISPAISIVSGGAAAGVDGGRPRIDRNDCSTRISSGRKKPVTASSADITTTTVDPRSRRPATGAAAGQASAAAYAARAATATRVRRPPRTRSDRTAVRTRKRPRPAHRTPPRSPMPRR